MAAPYSEVDLELVERNDPDIPVTLSKNGGALDLTGMTVECYFKDKETDADDASTSSKMSTADESVTVSNASQGECVIHAAASMLPAASTSRVWRVDVVTAEGKRHTCIKGKLTVDGI